MKCGRGGRGCVTTTKPKYPPYILRTGDTIKWHAHIGNLSYIPGFSVTMPIPWAFIYFVRKKNSIHYHYFVLKFAPIIGTVMENHRTCSASYLHPELNIGYLEHKVHIHRILVNHNTRTLLSTAIQGIQIYFFKWNNKPQDSKFAPANNQITIWFCTFASTNFSNSQMLASWYFRSNIS